MRVPGAVALKDPVLRILTASTFVATLGRGVFLAVTVLYFSLFIGLSAVEISIVYAVSALVGAGAGALAGQLSDVLSARRVHLVSVVLTGVFLASYAFAGDFWSVLVIASLESAAFGGLHASQSAIIARAFDGPHRVQTRAVLRTVTNIGIAVGSGLAAIALVINTVEAYRLVIVCAAALFALSAIWLVRLPATVDNARRDAEGNDRKLSRAESRAHSPWRDPRYLAMTVLNGVFGIQFALQEMGVPLWVAQHTTAPEATVSLLLVLNTLIVIALQVPLSKGTHELRRAGIVIAIAGVLMVAACLFYGGAGDAILPVAISLLVAGAIAGALAEVLQQAGSWGLGFELADPVRAGAYQGVFGMGFSVAGALGPFVVTATALTMGVSGWIILAVMFVLAAAGMSAIAWTAKRVVPPVEADRKPRDDDAVPA
jgi:MFS family permease